MNAEQGTQVATDQVPETNFTRIPNMAFRDLSPTAYKLLAVYIDIAKTVNVYAKNSTISEQVGVSVNTMKKARAELADKGYIIYTAGTGGKDTDTARVVIQAVWMWSENQRRADERHRVSNSDTTLSNSDSGVSNSDTNNQELYNQEPYKQKSSNAHARVSADDGLSDDVPLQSTPDKVAVDERIITLLQSVMAGTGELDKIRDRYDEYTPQQWVNALKKTIEYKNGGKAINSVAAYALGILKGESPTPLANEPRNVLRFSVDGPVKHWRVEPGA